VWLLTPGTAAADIVTDNQRDTVTVGRAEVRTAVATTGHESDPAYTDCVLEDLFLASFVTGFDRWTGTTTDTTTTSSVAWQSCTRVADSQQVGWLVGLDLTVAEVDPLTLLLEQARATIAIPLPDLATAPPVGGTQLVGLPIWFWSNTHFPTSVTATIPGLSATLTATPGALRVDLGDGTSLTCADGGTRYDPARSHRDQQTTCARPYDRHGPFRVTATVVWTLTWVATNGAAGTLPPVTRTATVDLDVQQAQAVTD
jgi:hypothetical protein